MRLTLPAIVVLCLAKHLSASPPQNSPENLSATAAAYMQTLEREEGFSGAVLLARDGKILFAQAYGMANLEHDVPNTLQTKFRLGSVTKQFTAVAIMMLQERRKLSVRDPICQYVHDCPDSLAKAPCNSHTRRWHAKEFQKLPANLHRFAMFWQEFSDGRKSAANGEPIHRQRH